MTFKLPFNQVITSEIERILSKSGTYWPPIFSFDQYFDRLIDYSIRGKMVRSNLVILSWQAYQKEPMPPSVAAVTLAAIQELSESGLLLQDDVMDADELRRGKPTMHLQYQVLALKKNPALTIQQAQKFGESWSITLGNLLFFYLFNLLAELPIDTSIRLNLIRLYSHELVITGSGQLADLAAGFAVVKPNLEEVSEINRQKTAHYTICLPLLAGAILAGVSQEELTKISAVGEIIGEIFQLTDDRLDLFSHSTVSGKTQGSDVRSGKRTMLYFFTFEGLQHKPQELTEFNQLYGKSSIQPVEIERVQQLVKNSGGYDRSEELVGELATRARQQLEKLTIRTESRDQFLQFLNFLITRDH